METAKSEVTNVERKVFVAFVSSVRIDSGSIMPERFMSTSSPVRTSLLPPELVSVSCPQTAAQGTIEFRD
jgi:hypothetical protein